MSDLGATTFELVSIPSPTGREERLCAFLEEWAGGLPVPCELRRWRNGLVVVPPAREGRPCWGLFGHLDTVTPASHQPLEVSEGRVYGCGASDMKSGLAVMMALLETAQDLSCDLVGVFYDREEGDYLDSGLDPLLDRIPEVEFGLILEPTNNRLQVGCVGGLHARVRFSGRRAHSARPWQGENAIYRALPLLERLRGWQPRQVELEGYPFFEVITATVARTENSRNVVPDVFDLNVNYRFAPGRTEASARRVVLDLVAGEAEVDFVDSCPAGAVCLDHPLLRGWMERESVPAEPKQAWTDVARLTGRGIPAVNFGPGDPAQAHQAGEWVEVEAVESCFQMLRRLLA